MIRFHHFILILFLTRIKIIFSTIKLIPLNEHILDIMSLVEHRNETQSVLINHKSNISELISDLWHDQRRSIFILQLKNESGCNDPYLFLRLSGAALLTPKIKRISTNIFIFHYHIPVSGLYHLELLFFGCDFNTSSTASLQEICFSVLPPDMTINEPYSVDLKSKTDHNIPAWVYTQNATIAPIVPTRYQPRTCYENIELKMEKTIEEADLCLKLVDRSWLNNYELINSTTFEHYNETCSQVPKSKSKSKRTICLLGASHSQKIQEAWNQFKVKRLKVEHIRIRHPSLWSKYSVNLLVNCSAVVLAMGQWSGVNAVKKAYGENEFYDQMERVIKDILLIPEKKLWLRTIHYNPLGVRKLTCPTADRRYPFLIEAYNRVLINLSAKFHIPLINTDFIIRPVWDTAKDYNHFIDKVSHYELFYIFNKICLDFL